jgi:hypothetical protein
MDLSTESVQDGTDLINLDQTADLCEYSNEHSGATTGSELLKLRPECN